MATVKKRVIGDGTYSDWAVRIGGTDHYLEVDDSTSVVGHDSDGTNIYSTYGSLEYCSFIFSTTGALVPDSATDISVDIVSIARGAASGKNINLLVYNDGTLSGASAKVMLGSYSDFHMVSTQAPSSGGNITWTPALVNSTAWEGAIQEGDNGGKGFVYCTQMYAEITYSVAEESTVTRSFLMYGKSSPIADEVLFRFEGIDTYNKVQGFIIEGKTTAYYTVNGNVEDWLGRKMDGHTITVNQGASEYSTVTDSNGDYIISIQEGNVEVVPSYNDWDYLPRHTSFTLDVTASGVDFVQSSVSRWWDYDSATGQGKHFAFRNKIPFSTPHAYLGENCVIDYPIQTGYQEKIASDGDFGEAVQQSGTQIYYQDGYTYVAYRNENADIILYQKSRPGDIWTSTNLGASGSRSDTHFYPAVCCNSDGLIYVFFCGHNSTLQYMVSQNPHDITAWLSKHSPGGSDLKCTYIRAKQNPINGDVYAFFRYGINYDGRWGFIRTKKSLGSQSWQSFRCIGRIYSQLYEDPEDLLKPVIYCGGVQIDDDGYCYLAMNYHVGYLEAEDNRWDYSVTFVYSDDIDTGYPVWHDIEGNVVGTSGLETQTSGYCSKDDGYIFQVTSTPSPGDVRKGTNNEALCISNLLYDNGSHTIKLPIILYSSSTGYAYGKSDYLISYYDTANTEWHTKNLSQEIGYQTYYPRSQGCILQKGNNGFQIYAFINSSDGSTNQHWNSLQLIRLSCTASTPGGTWNTKVLEKNQAFGSGSMSMKSPHYSGNMVEITYCRGNDVFYYSDIEEYGYFRNDGNDGRIIYKGEEIPRVGDYWSNVETNINFEIQKDLVEDDYYDTAGNYYVYYGAQSTTSPRDYASANPKDIYTFLESFENYNDGEKLDSGGAWTINKESSTALHSRNFTVVGPVDYFEVDETMYYPKAFYHYSGIKSCLINDTGDISGTAYVSTTIGINITDVIIEGELRKGYGAPYDIHHFMGIKSGSTVCALGKVSLSGNYLRYSYYGGSSWYTDTNEAPLHYNSHMKMVVSSVAGTIFYRYDTAGNEYVFGNVYKMKYFDDLIFGVSDLNDGACLAMFDFIRIRARPT